MNRNIFPLVLVLGICMLVSCKKKETTITEDQLKAQKIAFFTEKLNLTPQEAEKFWPVYNEYWDRKNQIIKEKRAAMNYSEENINKLTDGEVTKYVDLYINFQKHETDLLIEFNDRFKSVLPHSKVLKLYQTDYDFKNYLIRQLKESRQK